MDRPSFEQMLETALLELAERMLQAGPREGESPSSEVTRIDIARDEEIVWDFHHNIDLIEELSEEDFDPAPLFGATFIGRF